MITSQKKDSSRRISTFTAASASEAKAHFAIHRLLVVFVLTVTFLAADQKSPREQVQSESIIYSGQGFYPTSIRRPAGKVVLFINNRSAVAAPVFEIARENEGTLKRSPGRAGRNSVAQLLDLTPGTYVLKDSTHAGSSCTIVVTAK